MPVASWIAVALAASIPVAIAAQRRQGRSGKKTAGVMTAAALFAGLLGILN